VQDPAYVVQAGDSLSTIAARFSVTVDEIAEANGITDVDSITAGDELVIPPASRGGPQAGPGTTTASSAPPSTTPGSTGSPGTTAPGDDGPGGTATTVGPTSTTAG
jgi:LysM repeat protein